MRLSRFYVMEKYKDVSKTISPIFFLNKKKNDTPTNKRRNKVIKPYFMILYKNSNRSTVATAK